MEIKYHVICPHCKNTVEEEKDYVFIRISRRFQFQCKHCGTVFDLQDEPHVIKLGSRTVSAVALINLFLFALLVRIGNMADFQGSSFILLGYGVSAFWIIYLSPRVVQWLHNKEWTQEGIEKAKRFAGLVMALNIVLVFAWLIVLGTLEDRGLVG